VARVTPFDARSATARFCSHFACATERFVRAALAARFCDARAIKHERPFASVRDEWRAAFLAELAAQRAQREDTVQKLVGVSIKLIRSCNDQGVLYGSITQRDIADALVAAGYAVDMRAVRLAAPFRRIGSYTCTIQFEKELKADVAIEVAADRALEMLQAQKEAEEAAAAAVAASEAEDREEEAKAPRRSKAKS
jgi:large subunit ribosomal protein L9